MPIEQTWFTVNSSTFTSSQRDEFFGDIDENEGGVTVAKTKKKAGNINETEPEESVMATDETTDTAGNMDEKEVEATVAATTKEEKTGCIDENEGKEQ